MGWTMKASLVGLMIGCIVFAPGTLAVVLLALFVLLALVIRIVDESTDSIHRPRPGSDRGDVA
jgi:hypothetical protein